jgi:hypothetical protein
MSGPTSGPPAGPRKLLGEAGRERLVGLLREHYAAGRLDLEDLRRRVGVVLGAAYADEAAAALAGLPPSLAVGEPGPGRGQRGHRGRHAQAARKRGVNETLWSTVGQRKRFAVADALLL